MSYSKTTSENASLKEHLKNMELKIKNAESEREANHERELIKIKGMIGEIINMAFDRGDTVLADSVSDLLISLSLK